MRTRLRLRVWLIHAAEHETPRREYGIDTLKPVLHATLPEELRGIVNVQNDQTNTKPRPMDLSVATATRTLQAAGFDNTNVARHPGHIEYECEREDAFGAVVRYLVVIAAGNEPPSDVTFADRER
jgi:hypothetical protein